MSKQIGVVTEQGDLGLGWSPVSQEESTKLTNNNDNKNKDTKDGAK
jgi:hypothetical protein